MADTRDLMMMLQLLLAAVDTSPPATCGLMRASLGEAPKGLRVGWWRRRRLSRCSLASVLLLIALDCCRWA